MFLEDFTKDIARTFNPKWYDTLVDAPISKGIKYYTKILVIAYLVMVILLIPSLVSLKSDIQDELTKFEQFEAKGTVLQSSAIQIPEKEPLIIIDATGNEVNPGREKVTITRDSLYYKFFAGRKEVPLSQIKNLDKPVVSKLLLYILLFIAPSVIFYTFAGIWLKYFLFAFLVGTIVFLMADLTRFSQPWRKCVLATCYSSTIIISVETVSSAVYSKWMVPLVSFWNLHIYLIPLVAWLILSLAFVVLLHFFKSQKHSKN
ncbi:DUF1189 domain-containing protein [Candidatus Woesearchaeota archaeon]|nr:DUF1189 domain-containing protein [Candidatus Woesearchaeota archaeon]